jgi:hypothetical protein
MEIRRDMKRLLSAVLCASACAMAFASDGHGHGDLNARNQYVVTPARASLPGRIQCTGYGNAGYGNGPLSGLRQSRATNECIRPFFDGMAAVQLPPSRQAASPTGADRSPYNWGFLDTDGKLAIKPRFGQAHDFSHGFAAVERNGLWGYVDKQGKWAIAPRFGRADDFSQTGLASVRRKDGRLALIDTQGKAVRMFDASVRDAYLADGFPGLLKLRYNDEWLSAHGKTVVTPAGLRVGMPLDTPGLFVAADESGKYGVANAQGKWLVKPRFDYVSAPASEGGLLLASGGRGRPDALIDQAGKVVTGKEVREAKSLGSYFWELTLNDGTRQLANARGKIVVPDLEVTSRWGVLKVGRFAVWQSKDRWYVAVAGGDEAQAAPKGAGPERNVHGGALWWTDGRGHLTAVLTRSGQWVKGLPWFASVANGFSQGGYQVFKDGRNALVNILTPAGKPLLAPDVARELQRHSIDFMDTIPDAGTRPVALATIGDCACDENTGAGLLLSDGTVLRNPEWYEVKSLDSRAPHAAGAGQADGQRFRVQTATGYGMMDAAGHMLIAPTQRFIGPFSHGISLVYDGNKSYVANRQGKLAAVPDYFLIEAAGPGLLRFHETAIAGAPWGLYDIKAGKVLVPPVLKTLGLFDHGHAVASDARGGAGVLNRQGTWVVPPRFGSLEPLSPTLWLAGAAPEDGSPDGGDDESVSRSVVSLNGKTVVPPTKGLHARVLGNGFVLAYQASNDGRTAGSQWLISDKGKEIAGGPGLRIEKTKTGWWDIKRADTREYVDGNGRRVPSPAKVEVARGTTVNTAGAAQAKGAGGGGEGGKTGAAPRYDELGRFVDGLAFAGGDGAYGYVNRDNRFVIAPAFQAASVFDHGAAVASTRDSSMVIDTSGRPLARVAMHCGRRVLFDADNDIAWPRGAPKNCQ